MYVHDVLSVEKQH